MAAESNVLNRREYAPSAAAIFLALVVFVALNLLTIGGEGFILNLNSSLILVASVIAALFAVWNWLRTSDRDSSRSIWGWLAFGLLLWALAEFISAAYPLFFHREIPEISLADAFWLLGYLPITLALVLRARSMGVNPSLMQFGLAGLFILVVAGISVYFVILPAIRSADTGDMLSASINMLYPVADLVILSISLFIFFTFSGSNFALVWQVLAIGLILRSFSDLLYNYSIGLDLYWPDNHLTPASVLVDSTYLASYLMLAQGIYLQRLVARQRGRAHLAGSNAAQLPRAQGNSDVLLYTDALGDIISVSSNFLRLVQASDEAQMLGLSLEDALGLDGDTAAALLYEVEHWGYIRSREITIYNRQKQPLRVWLTAAANREDLEFSGADIVLRATLAEDVPDGETRALAGQVYARSGALQVENLALLKAYGAARVHLLAGLLVSWGGRSLSRVMEEMFVSIVQSHHSRLKLVDGELVCPDDENQESLLKVMPALLDALTQYAESIAGYEHTHAAILELEAGLEPADQRSLEQFGLLVTSLDPLPSRSQ